MPKGSRGQLRMSLSVLWGKETRLGNLTLPHYTAPLVLYEHLKYGPTPARGKDRRAHIDALKALFGCAECGEKHIGCLDFHHVGTERKLFNISALISGKGSWLDLVEEVGACIILCANCHRKLHWSERKANKYKDPYHPPVPIDPKKI